MIIRRIHEFAEDDPDLLNYLIEHKIVPGIQVQVQDLLPFNQTMTILVENRPVTLGLQAARYIFAEPLDPT